MPDLHQALARYRDLADTLHEENQFSARSLTARELDQVLIQAAEDAIEAGATYEDFQEIGAAYP